MLKWGSWLSKDGTLFGWAKAIFCGVGAKSIEKKMLFRIHLDEILYLPYLSTRCSSEPKLGYGKRYQWDGDEGRELLREPGPWKVNNLWMGWEEKAPMSDEHSSEWVSSGGYGLLSTHGLDCVWVGCSTQQETQYQISLDERRLASFIKMLYQCLN